MKNKLKSLMLLAGFTLATTSAFADFKMTLGSVQDVTNWFSYPNNCAVICYKNWTLEQTAEHYLNQSLLRDGYKATATVHIENAATVSASFSGNMPDDYQKTVETFLSTGTLAHKAASQINSDQKWAYDWLFFLPQGMAMRNHKTLEFLHFPPDYSLTKVQDYLISSTTDRWNVMLETNNVPSDQTALYQTVLDLAPIAAPASAGSTLSETYAYFQDYDLQMLQNWTMNPEGQILPVVAFGSPVRNWIKDQFDISLSVNEVAYIGLPNNSEVPFMGANHPSYIWYAGNEQGCDDTPEKAYERGTTVMLQDAIASCWQASMGGNPTQDAKDVAASCTTQWKAKPKQICEMYYEQVKYKTPEEAAELCKDVTKIKSMELDGFAKSLPADFLTRHSDPEELSMQ